MVFNQLKATLKKTYNYASSSIVPNKANKTKEKVIQLITHF